MRERMLMETEETVDLWLLAKKLKKRGASNSMIKKVLRLYRKPKYE
jgi:hypothetical protein